MEREIHKIYDFLLKIIITIYGNDFLRYIQEKRQITEILKTEITTVAGKTFFMDFLCLLEDDTLCNIEFQYKPPNLEKLNTIFQYNI